MRTNICLVIGKRSKEEERKGKEERERKERRGKRVRCEKEGVECEVRM